MGKNLIQQKRGKGSTRYTAPSFRYSGEAKYPPYTAETVPGKIMDIIHSQGHSAPLMKIQYANRQESLLQAPESVRVGDPVSMGPEAEIKPGCVLALKHIPEGTSVYNIESKPGDGGKFCRTSGTFAKVISRQEGRIIVQLPSSKQRWFLPECRALIGVIAGSGRPEKPFVKAGNRFYARRARNKYWPMPSGTAMNAVSHPFGGKGSHTKGRPTQSSRHDPPGRKVGKIAPRRTGRRKK